MPYRVKNVASRVLELERFLQAPLVRGLYADEHPSEVGLPEEVEKLVVLSDIERRLRAEKKLVIVLLLIVPEIRHELLGDGLVPDEVVVDEEYVRDAEFPERVELLPHLIEGLYPRLSAEHDYYVAEFAAVRAPPRKLEAHRLVLVELEQVEAGRWGILERNLLAFLIELLRGAAVEV